MLRDIREIVNGSVSPVDSQSSVFSPQSSAKAKLDELGEGFPDD
jgi:hypothetical protein